MLRQGTSAVVTTLCCLMAASALAADLTKDSLETVKKNIADKKAVLVDVREKAEWDAGHIEGAIFLPLSQLQADKSPDAWKKQLPEGVIIYTHCVIGKRSVTAGNILAKHRDDIRPLKAGYRELVQAGFKPAAK
ncbi:MAG TPA: rhodanese-like domain-containing protein [Planctomycetaceae bacterium]|nr:rhodanese-like domain-containing protein [Planctomycetaceae bacterium]